MNFRELRRGMIVISNTLAKMPKSKELSSVNNSAQKTMMWTGTYMKFAKLGDNPYAKLDGNRETIKDIEPLFDATKNTLDKDILNQGLIFTVDSLRTYLNSQIEYLMSYMTNIDEMGQKEKNFTPEQTIHTNLCLFNIYTNLTETRLWLGMELGRIRDSGEKRPKAKA